MEEKASLKTPLEGLFPGKGQRVEDLALLNPQWSNEEIEEELEDLVTQGVIEFYSSGGQKYYMRFA